MPSQSGASSSSAVAIHTGAAALPAPTVAPGAALLLSGHAWRGGGLSARAALLKVWGSDGSVDIAGPVEVVGYHAVDQRWYYAGTLDEGAAINVGDGANAPGRTWKLFDLPAWASAVQLKGGAIAGGTISAAIEPLEISGPE